MATSGRPRSEAAFRWSPARTPRPPEYCGTVSLIPNSGEKYATRPSGDESRWSNHRGDAIAQIGRHPGKVVMGNHQLRPAAFAKSAAIRFPLDVDVFSPELHGVAENAERVGVRQSDHRCRRHRQLIVAARAQVEHLEPVDDAGVVGERDGDIRGAVGEAQRGDGRACPDRSADMHSELLDQLDHPVGGPADRLLFIEHQPHNARLFPEPGHLAF